MPAQSRRRLKWPEVGKTYPDPDVLHAEARPAGSANSIDLLPEGAGIWKSRVSQGYGPDGKRIFWCQVCNTRVPSRNNTFCEAHSRQWANIARERRNAKKRGESSRAVTLTDEQVNRLTDLATRMQAHRGTIREALAIPTAQAQHTNLDEFRRVNSHDLNALFETTSDLYRLISDLTRDNS